MLEIEGDRRVCAYLLAHCMFVVMWFLQRHARGPVNSPAKEVLQVVGDGKFCLRHKQTESWHAATIYCTGIEGIKRKSEIHLILNVLIHGSRAR